jgi:hypothetical protein
MPIDWRSEITDSTESPFSDRLMLFHKMFDITYSVTANGFALGNCTRTDLVTAFVKATIDLKALGKDGMDLLVENGWMEDIPLVADREKIISSNH